jgi:hypothetical protein
VPLLLQNTCLPTTITTTYYYYTNYYIPHDPRYGFHPRKATATKGVHDERAKAEMAVSILQRKRDFVYLVFFLTHLPVMLGEFSVG